MEMINRPIGRRSPRGLPAQPSASTTCCRTASKRRTQSPDVRQPVPALLLEQSGAQSPLRVPRACCSLVSLRARIPVTVEVPAEQTGQRRPVHTSKMQDEPEHKAEWAASWITNEDNIGPETLRPIGHYKRLCRVVRMSESEVNALARANSLAQLRTGEILRTTKLRVSQEAVTVRAQLDNALRSSRYHEIK